MRFIIDAQNFMGMLGLSLAAGLGYGLGRWLIDRLTSLMR